MQPEKYFKYVMSLCSDYTIYNRQSHLSSTIKNFVGTHYIKNIQLNTKAKKCKMDKVKLTLVYFIPVVVAHKVISTEE